MREEEWGKKTTINIGGEMEIHGVLKFTRY